MNTQIQTLIERLNQFAIRDHFNCPDDTWYGCPLSSDGCSDDKWPKDECNCGVDIHNAKVKEVVDELRKLFL